MKLNQFVSNRHFKHGMSGSPTYNSWKAMKQRCLNSRHIAYKRYGGAGISICPQWNDDFSKFVKDMGERPTGTTLERINNALGYFPENCKWATRMEQSSNTRQNVIVDINGQRKTLSQWSRDENIGVTTLHYRLRCGISGIALIDHDLDQGKYQKRKTHCPAGHKYTEENTYINNGCRKCRECNKLRARIRRNNYKPEQV